ncbi:MAG TPA: hypothetical protein VKA68_18325, partial [bacterium]|nr:hypothetical protein [bacterium]
SSPIEDRRAAASGHSIQRINYICRGTLISRDGITRYRAADTHPQLIGSIGIVEGAGRLPNGPIRKTRRT